MKYLLSMFLLVFAASSFAASQKPELLEAGSGFTRLRITDPVYLAKIQGDLITGVKAAQANGVSLNNPGTRTTISSVPVLTGEIVVVDTLRGVMASNFPRWLKRKFFEKAGYTAESVKTITDAQLDAKIPRTAIEMDALSAITKLKYVPASPPSSTLPTLPPGVTKQIAPAGSMYPQSIFSDLKESISDLFQDAGDLIGDLLCEKKEEGNSKNWTFPLNKSAVKPLESNIGGVNTSFSTLVRGDGVMSAEVFYTVTKRCIPYSIEFNRAEFKLDSTLGGEFGFNAKASYAYKKDGLFKESINFPLAEYDFWVYIFEFQLKVDLNFDVGVDFAAAAAAEVQSTYALGGHAAITWVCTSSNCTKTRSIVDLKPVLKKANSYQAQVEVKVTPFVDTSIGADLKLYWGALDLVSARVGILSQFPITVFAYAGNMCSDANGDGVPEDVRAGYLDVAAVFSGYLQGNLLGKGSRFELDLGMSAFGYTRTQHNSGDLEGKTQKVLYTKNLYFKDLLSGGSSILQPVIRIPAVSKTQGAISIGKRSCYQFNGDVIYEVDWGDGSLIEKGTSTALKHTWPRFGDYTIRVRIAGDSQGRTFDTAWMTQKMNVSPDGVTPFYPWLSVLMELLND